MAKRNSSSAQALLGLLTIEPMSGYDIAQVVRDSIGHMWSESYGQIYPNLKKLAAEGLVARRTERHAGKPDRNIYSITKKGRERLAEWLAVPPQPEVPRNELLLKLFFGVQAPPGVLIGYLEKMVAENGKLLEKFKQIESEHITNQPYPDVPYWRMAARFGQLEMEAHVKWAEESLTELRRIEREREGKEASKNGKRAGSRADKEKAHARR